MPRESLEELRKRLLQEERVLEMISVRAYEIFEMRGFQEGGAAQDWFDAENEVLAFLIANEPQRVHPNEALEPPSISEPVAKEKATVSKAPNSRGKSGKKPASKGNAAKGVTTKKPTGTKSKPRRTRKQPKPESTE